MTQELNQTRLTLTWDVLKPVTSLFLQKTLQINFNMGCIETEVTCNYTEYEHGLTLTWDVLKPVAPFSCDNFFWINFNMGCIETL